ncbi:MAG: NADPH-dependent glutamate synthase [Candidatus Latescibacteria bacterium]|nr:NADPH-dependent glutamate synthase [Candidatus Latescibacterota bacterium]NIM21785.1 NADPH-dependent glutamate synthase [Candidatus Latescibacterota bacterium]NIM65923.1 NADPH-dependent glutamate synthase [Candidatus Latescibacterota bacterium]NIO02668.1 NADPH-dependent glutamate synthase [Candidatus Latescibacterota bacterium]NIO29649.1 NADPH-dependent glutamate synthase [Candidatus Latescibacterota bacterium]
MSGNEKKAKKEKKKIIPKKNPMPEQDPKVRRHNFEEVPYGYTPELAQKEAERCIMCKKPLCIDGCPVNIDIPGFIKMIAEGDYVGAARKIKEENCLPAICGRVCPQETQCEIVCTLAKKFEPVAIGRLERFAADYERDNNLIELPKKLPPNGRKIAVVGSGPAGLTVAGDLIVLGYEVTIYEAFHKPGGVLMYGIPEFRLPKKIVEEEVDYLKKLGVTLEFNQVIGKSITVDELLKDMGYNAVFIGVGAGLPSFLGIPGEELGGVYSANEYLTRSNLMKAFLFPEYDTPIVRGRTVCVVGGGNVAMDAARTALRLGAENVYIVYRRSRTELPAREEEIHHAEEEGIIFKLLTNPVEMYGDERGMVKRIKCQEMELGEPDESGRRRPVPKEGCYFTIDTDLVIIAIGGQANPLLTKSMQGLELNKWGNIVADENGRTSAERVWAGGDIVTGSATVIEAMGAGKKAAADIHKYLSDKEKQESVSWKVSN